MTRDELEDRVRASIKRTHGSPLAYVDPVWVSGLANLLEEFGLVKVEQTTVGARLAQFTSAQLEHELLCRGAPWSFSKGRPQL